MTVPRAVLPRRLGAQDWAPVTRSEGMVATAHRAPSADIDRLFVDAVHSVAEALKAKDAYTRNHSQRVSLYARAIAEALGLCGDEVREVRLAGQLHDVGKIGVPDDLLCRQGPLSAEEYRRVMQHTVIGEQILRPLLHDHPTVLAVVRWHHERVDGTGLPDGLCGDEIPLAARIVAVADSYDAMTSARPYRSVLPLRAAVRQLEQGADSQFDAECVRAFLAVLARSPTLRRRVLPDKQALRVAHSLGMRRAGDRMMRTRAGWRSLSRTASCRPRSPPRAGSAACERRPVADESAHLL